MPDMSTVKPRGRLLSGWSARVEDYAIAGTWACRGEVLVVADAVGGLFGFQGDSGILLWSHHETHEGGILAITAHPDLNVVTTAGQDGHLLLWNARDGELIKTIELGRGWVDHVEWSSDGQWLAASCSRRVHVYRADGEEAWRSDDHPSTVSAIAWSGTQELATACYGRVSFFSASSGQLNQKLEWQGSLVSMVLSPDGDVVACGSQDNSVHFWRRSTAEDSMMAGYPGKPSALAFDDTGTLLATGGGDAVTVWSFQGDGPEGTRPGVLTFHTESITSLTFSSRQQLASGSRDGSVVMWELSKTGNGRAVGAARLNALVSILVWRPDGLALAALDAHGGVSVWRVGR